MELPVAVFSAISGLGLGCIGMMFVVCLVILLSAMFWGWPIMVIAGACGWNIPFWPVSVALGLIPTFFLG